MNCKRMLIDDLDNVMERLRGVDFLLHLLSKSAGNGTIMGAAIRGVDDLLTQICEDFQEDIDTAPQCAETEKEASS